LGNGTIIENSAIGFVDGKINLVADARVIRLASGAYDIPSKQVENMFIRVYSSQFYIGFSRN
jgi:hypothetical protein